MTLITAVDVRDIRFPTSGTLDGSDAMNTDPDYSATYVTLVTDDGDGPLGHGLAFTNGRGNEVCVAAVHALAPAVLRRSVDGIFSDMVAFTRSLVADSQLRWLGPEKGVLHLAAAALVNAVWDLYAKLAGKPLWRALADLPPEQLVACVDFRYLHDALRPDEALEILRRNRSGRPDRECELLRDGFPAYTTSVGWLGYDDDKVRQLCREAVATGWKQFKMKVGGDPADDRRRAAIVREEIGPDRKLMMDANQRWGVDEAIERIRGLAEFDPWWVEEPTSPDDVLGHATIARAVAPIAIASGENAANRVMFKQLLQADAIAFCQVDSCRLAGVNEVLAVLLLAAKFGVPVCPHAGGLGLCEYVQHLAVFDYLCVGASLHHRVLEYVDHLHEHFVDPVVVRDARYRVPERPGYSIEMRAESLAHYRFPEGPAWNGAPHGAGVA
ncbi:MAG: fuconate dehydratase [Euzebyaceae bacterium]|jgi:L-fuconate dehydratase|nr:fuconate dehydratase [Euzebyaceae bacterium]